MKNTTSAKILLKNTPRLLKLVWQSSKTYFLFTVLLTIIQGLVPVFEVTIGKYLLDSVSVILTAPVITPSQIRDVIFWVGLELCIILTGIICNILKNSMQKVFGDLVLIHTMAVILEKAANLEAAFYENDLFYDKLMKARQGAHYRPVQILQLFFEILQSCISLLGYIGLIFFFNSFILLVLFITSLPLLFLEVRYSQKIYKIFESRVPELRQKEYFSWLLTDKWPFKEIKLFQLHEHFITKYKELAHKHIREDKEIFNKRNRSSIILNILLTVLYYTTYGYVIFIGILKKISIGSFIMYTRTIKMIQDRFRNLLNAFSKFYEENLYLADLFAFLEVQSTLPDGQIKNGNGSFVTEKIQFHNVSFQYPDTDKWVLKNINLEIKAGSHLALVGLNGSGKTTLVKLLCRFYDPTEGTILIDGLDIRHFDKTYLRRHISTIFQDYMRYELPVRENIGLGDVSHLAHLEKIREAALKSEANQFIEQLPHTYEERLGRTLAKGVELSLGQWQKIALARAFMRDGAILILDEPTASLDAEAEHKLFEKFDELTRGRLSLLISHRFSTVKMCKQIIVLKDGCIYEQGSHEELLMLNGEYARLYTLQADSFVRDGTFIKEHV